MPWVTCGQEKEFQLKGFISLEEINLSRQKQNYRIYLVFSHQTCNISFLSSFTHTSIASFLWDIDKQYRPQNAVSGQDLSLFAYRMLY